MGYDTSIYEPKRKPTEYNDIRGAIKNQYETTSKANVQYGVTSRPNYAPIETSRPNKRPATSGGVYYSPPSINDQSFVPSNAIGTSMKTPVSENFPWMHNTKPVLSSLIDILYGNPGQKSRPNTPAGYTSRPNTNTSGVFRMLDKDNDKQTRDLNRYGGFDYTGGGEHKRDSSGRIFDAANWYNLTQKILDPDDVLFRDKEFLMDENGAYYPNPYWRGNQEEESNGFDYYWDGGGYGGGWGGWGGYDTGSYNPYSSWYRNLVNWRI